MEIMNRLFRSNSSASSKSSIPDIDYPPLTESRSNPVIGTYPFIQSCNHMASLNLVIMWPQSAF